MHVTNNDIIDDVIIDDDVTQEIVFLLLLSSDCLRTSVEIVRYSMVRKEKPTLGG